MWANDPTPSNALTIVQLTCQLWQLYLGYHDHFGSSEEQALLCFKKRLLSLAQLQITYKWFVAPVNPHDKHT
jgi:hypothetical protein